MNAAMADQRLSYMLRDMGHRYSKEPQLSSPHPVGTLFYL
ncbi:hypothetical protein ASAP_0060 [Asaia bogorensis]|uniref:Uncharacterized protein n=1 Tax=Asaia bogorensis TaxID=91915 RepID=A0A060QB42_9PROT|nr:hypothetical protein ASAP_0060 [Asaia bogorensis]